MRASIGAQGFTALAETLPDGTLTLSLIDANGHTLAVGTWAEAVPAETPLMRPAEAWPAQGAA
jgi:hypothetical protein